MRVRVTLKVVVVGLYRELQSTHEFVLALSTDLFCEPLLVQPLYTNGYNPVSISICTGHVSLQFQLLL